MVVSFGNGTPLVTIFFGYSLSSTKTCVRLPQWMMWRVSRLGKD
jgi:hypothetical protein